MTNQNTKPSFEESLKEVRKALIDNCPEIGMVYHGIATHLIDIQNFYIVPLKLHDLLLTIEIPGKKAENIEQYDNIIYYSPTLKQFARGTVRSVEPNGNCIIFAKDYGLVDMEITPCTVYKTLLKETENVPGFAQLCELVMCFPCLGGQFTQENVESFKFFMGQPGEKLTVTITEKNNYKLGVLVQSSNSNPDDVSTVMHYSKNSVLWSTRP